MTGPEQLTIEARGLRFGALAWGEAGAPLALLVHGFPDTAWTWRHLGPALAAHGWRAVAPFTRGYAPTDVPADGRYRLADQAADLLALHAALDGDERAVLVGHDWGALATWSVAAQEPERFARLVALAVPPVGSVLRVLRPASAGLGLRQLRSSWYIGFNLLPCAERTLGRLIPRLWRDWSPGFDGEPDAGRALAALATADRRTAALAYYRANLRFGAGLRAAVAVRPRAPVLYLHGEHDGCMRAAVGASYAPHLPAGSRFELVPGTGHFLQLEDPERVNALILDWLTRPA